MGWREDLDRLGGGIALVPASTLVLASTLMAVIPWGFAFQPTTQAAEAADKATGPTPQQVDLAPVREKIAALAVADEAAPYDQQAVNWLSMRRQQILPQLIAALNDEHPRVAEECLKLLRGAPVSKELTDALVAKAGDEKSPLRYEALRQLEKSAADPRAARLLLEASLQAEKFSNPVVRARWAWLGGNHDRAVEILGASRLLDPIDDSRYERIEAIRLLGEIGSPAGAALLRPIAAGDRWGLAVEAHQALAKIDPAKHGLTKDQATLLRDWHGHKETSEQFRRRMGNLAQLNVRELRPFVIQALRDKDHAGIRPALLILTAWKDKGALPQIRTLMQEGRSFYRQEAVAAWLSIDDGPEAQKVVLDLLRDNDRFSNEYILRGIVAAEIPADRKLAILRAARARLKPPRAVPDAIAYSMPDFAELAAALMETETDLPALGRYCELAVRDERKRFGAQVGRAMRLLSSDPAVSAGGERVSSETAAAGQAILRAVAVYDLKDLAADVRKLAGSGNATLRAAAQATGAKLDIPGAMADLYAQLDAEKEEVRKLAVEAIMNIQVADETQRAAREAALLARVGKVGEDYALRALTICGREKSVKVLESLLDGPDAQRALYAAWVLAQLPDAQARTKAIRRVAIFGMFQHQFYQAGEGIDFPIAPGLWFHQVTGWLGDSNRASSSREGPVRIPQDFLALFSWDDAEQRYAVRCYQLANVARREFEHLGVDFLGHPFRWRQGPVAADRTHLPLLNEMAAHDWHVQRLMVKGEAVAHFPARRDAARAIRAVTSKAASYVGLAGERLDSEAFPQPYKNQNELLARFILDRVQKARLPENPQTDRHWQQWETHRVTIVSLGEQFGPQVLDAIRREAQGRQINTKYMLPPPNP